jgi:alanine dehydrogenase
VASVGINAAKIAAGMGAHVTILEISLDRLRYLDDVLPTNVDTVYSNRYNILEAISRADLVVGAVLLIGAKAPHLILRDDLKLMKQGAVVVDVAVDQGGCVETIKPTTHENPTYFVDGILHYAVAKHARWRAAHLDARADQRDAALRAQAREAWLARRVPQGSALRLGLNVVDWQGRLPGVAERSTSRSSTSRPYSSQRAKRRVQSARIQRSPALCALHVAPGE